MANRRIHIQPLPFRLLAGDDQVDVVAAAQAMVRHRQQAIRVRRQIDPHDIGLLVGDMVDEAGILVGKAIVILAPDMGGQKIIERRDGLAPADGLAGFQEFGMLVEHGIDDVDEGLVTGEETVAAGQQIAFQPAFAEMLAQHFHDAARLAEIGVVRDGVRHPFLAGNFENSLKPVRGGLVGPEQTEVLGSEIEFHHVAQERAQYPRRLRPSAAGLGNRHRIGVKMRHRKRLQQLAAIGVRVEAHAAMAGRRERGEFLAELAAFVEQFLAADSCASSLQVVSDVRAS